MEHFERKKRCFINKQALSVVDSRARCACRAVPGLIGVWGRSRVNYASTYREKMKINELKVSFRDAAPPAKLKPVNAV